MSEPQFDHKAGKQIFLGEKTPVGCLTVPKDTENPIDIRLRQLAMSGEKVDLKVEFIGKNVAVIAGKDGTVYVGKLADIYATRDIRVKTRNGLDIIVPFGDIIEVSNYEL